MITLPAEPVAAQWRILPPDFATIPDQLRFADQWLGWRGRWKPDGRLDKPPCHHETGKTCDAHAPANWGTCDQARAGYERHQLSGVGFDLTEHDPYAVADLDHCGHLDAAGDFTFTDPVAAAIVAALDSYTERTPSGEGLRVWVHGTVPAGRCKIGNIELYDHKRYVTVTGRHLAGMPTTIEPRQAELEAVHAEYLGASDQANEEKPRPPAAPVDLDDAALLERAHTARNGAKFARLWSGDTSDYAGDDSAADLALMNLLAFWTGRDAARMDRLFRAGGLMRDKWDSGRGQSTYGRWTIDRASANCRETYTPSWADPAIDTFLSGIETPAANEVPAPTPTGQLVPPDLPPEVATLVARLERENRELRQREEEAQAKLRACQEQWGALRALMRDPDLDAAYKLVLVGRFVLRAEMRHHGKAGEDGRTPEPERWVAERVGMSERRVRDKMAAQDAAHLFDREKRTWTEERVSAAGVITKEPRQGYYARPCTDATTMAPILRLAIKQKPPVGMPGAGKDHGHGGKREPACPQHPDAGTIEEVTGLYERRSTKCAACRRVLATTERPVEKQPVHPAAPAAPALGAGLRALYDRAEGALGAAADPTGQLVRSPEAEPDEAAAPSPVDYVCGQVDIDDAAPDAVPTPPDASATRQDAPGDVPAGALHLLDGMVSLAEYDRRWGDLAPPPRQMPLTAAGGAP